MAEAFDITLQTSDETLLDRGRGEVKLQVTNRLGRSVRTRIGVEPEGEQGARSDWLVVGKPEHTFAPGGSTVVTVQAAVPAGTPAGRYRFRLVVTATPQDAGAAPADAQADAQSRSAPVTLRHESRSRSLWAALIMGGVVAALAGFGLYRWLAPPPCETERAIRDDSGQCVCPAGMVESPSGDRSICLCASGTDYDPGAGACVPRACEVENALYAEAAGACECPSGTYQAKAGGRDRCVCHPGQRYDQEARACVPEACATPERARYDERTGQCECPEGTERKTRPDGVAVCECAAGRQWDEPSARCLAPPNLRVLWVTVFPPLRMQRLFSFETAVENDGEIAAGPFRLHVEATRAGVRFRDQKDVPELAPGKSFGYESPQLRIEVDEPLRVRAWVEPLGAAEASTDDNALEESFPITVLEP